MVVRHLYLHVPFCLRRCSYCDFAVTPTRRPATEEWLESIAAELDLVRRTAPVELLLATVYAGGGTPSLLGTGAMRTLRDLLAAHAAFEPEFECSAEANPENLTPDLALDWASAGINRVSIGLQSFQQSALRWMGRLHGAAGGRAAVAAARQAGITNINIDLIFALPQHLERDWRADLEQAIELEPTHVSLYGLSAEPTAALGRWVREGRAALPSEDRYAQEYLLAVELLAAAGYRHYEVSNFAKPGCESQHNRAYWSGAAYLGLGPSAHSLLPPVRSWNLRDWKQYRAAIVAKRLPRAEAETLSAEAGALERIWLALRTDGGLQLSEVADTQCARLQQWQSAGWASTHDGMIRLTPSGWLLLDQLAVELASAASA